MVGGRGPDLLVARATTRPFRQSVLSKQLNPPVRWSCRRLILWRALAFLGIDWSNTSGGSFPRLSRMFLETWPPQSKFFLSRRNCSSVLQRAATWTDNELRRQRPLASAGPSSTVTRDVSQFPYAERKHTSTSQHSEAQAWLHSGNTVELRGRNKVIARIVPAAQQEANRGITGFRSAPGEYFW